MFQVKPLVKAINSKATSSESAYSLKSGNIGEKFPETATAMNSQTPSTTASPGSTISVELRRRGWSQSDLAVYMGCSVQFVNDLIRGNRPLTIDTALKLEATLDNVKAEEWLRLEATYRVALARQKVSVTVGSAALRELQRFPLREMTKRGWIPKNPDPTGQAQELCRFLGVGDLCDFQPEYRANFRAKLEHESQKMASAMWIRRVLHVAKSQEVGQFDANLLSCLPHALLDLSDSVSGIRNVAGVLAEHGIRFVIVPQLPGTRLDGALIWDDLTPIIALTLRFSRVDYFWFTLMHEVAHLCLRHEGTRIDSMEGGLVDAEERAADKTAQEWLIPATDFDAFVSSPAGFFRPSAIKAFAEQVGRHPGIVTGRLQREQYLPYSSMRSFLEPVKGELEGLIQL